MKPVQSDRLLIIAITLSLLAHGVLLALHVSAPVNLAAPLAPGLEVILVNAKHDSKPKKADALAQANLDGGGNADAGRAKSPLPDSRTEDDGDSFEATKRRIAALEQVRRTLLLQANRPSLYNAPRLIDNTEANLAPGGADRVDSHRAIARMAAEISEAISDQNKRPRKTFITPSTQQVGYAIYYKALQ
jgi:protein TonB